MEREGVTYGEVKWRWGNGDANMLSLSLLQGVLLFIGLVLNYYNYINDTIIILQRQTNNI